MNLVWVLGMTAFCNGINTGLGGKAYILVEGWRPTTRGGKDYSVTLQTSDGRKENFVEHRKATLWVEAQAKRFDRRETITIR